LKRSFSIFQGNSSRQSSSGFYRIHQSRSRTKIPPWWLSWFRSGNEAIFLGDSDCVVLY